MWEGGTLQTDAAQLYLFVPIPAKAKKLGLLSIYIFSLERGFKKDNLCGTPVALLALAALNKSFRYVRGHRGENVLFNWTEEISIPYIIQNICRQCT